MYAVFLTLMRAAARRSNTGSTLIRPAWFSLYAALFLIGGSSVSGEPLRPPTWQAWTLLFLLAALAQVAGWWTISSALPRVKGSVGGLMLLLQPVLATIWSAVLFGETLVPLQIAGAGVTLGAIYVGSTGGRPRP